MKGHAVLAHALRLLIEETLDQALADRGLSRLRSPETEDQSRSAWRSATAARVVSVVAIAFGITAQSIICKSRRQPWAIARQTSICILRDSFGFSASQAIAVFNLTDRTTATHAVRAVNRHLARCTRHAAPISAALANFATTPAQP